MRATLLFTFLCIIGSTLGNHFRYGHMTWTPGQTDHKEITITFNLVLTLDWGPFILGDTFDVGLEFGDGNYDDCEVVFDTIDYAANDALGSCTISHTYASDGTYRTYWSDSSRQGTLNNPGTSWYISTDVVVGLTGGLYLASPVSTNSPMVFVGANSVNTFSIPASDPNGLPLTFTISDDLIGAGDPGDPIPQFSVSTSGVVTWDTTGLTLGKYVTQLKISNGYCFSVLDFMLTIVDYSVTPPPVLDSPAEGTLFYGSSDVLGSWNLVASSPTSGVTASLSFTGLPTSVNITTSGTNPVTYTLSWIPTSANIGNNVFIVRVRDSTGLWGMGQRAYTIVVGSAACPEHSTRKNGVCVCDERYNMNENVCVLSCPATRRPKDRVCVDKPVITNVKTLRLEDAKKRALEEHRVAIYGLHFGTPGLAHLTAAIGAFPCIRINHISSTELHCTAKGYGLNWEVVVVRDGVSADYLADIVGGGKSIVRYDYNPATNPCPTWGNVDAINGDYCNCWSGAASLSPLYKDCLVQAVCAGHPLHNDLAGEYPPLRPTTSFEDDKLLIKQQMPIVQGRRDLNIQFAIPELPDKTPDLESGSLGSTTCFYPGVLWQKKLNDLDCLDEFYGVLPWSQHELCGFVEDNDPSFAAATPPVRIFKSNLVTSYTELYKDHAGIVKSRKQSVTYLLSATFVRQIVVQQVAISAIIADEQSRTSLALEIISNALYDVASRNTFVRFRTTFVWPYKINYTYPLVGSWIADPTNPDAGKPLDVQATIEEYGDDVCNSVQDTDCEQTFLMTVKTPNAATPVCNLLGAMKFNTDVLLCRDFGELAVPCPVEPQVNFSIAFGPTSLCDTAPAADASKGLALTLTSYYDEDLSIPQNVFQTGDMLYFQLEVSNPTSTIDKITINKIVVGDAPAFVTSNTLWEVSAPGVLDSPVANLSQVLFSINKEIRPAGDNDFSNSIAPGSVATLGFEFKASREHLAIISDLASGADSSKTLDVQVTIDIWYHGNSLKRSVTLSTPALAQMQIRLISNGDELEEAEAQAVAVDADANVEESLFASGASTSTVGIIMIIAAILAIVC